MTKKKYSYIIVDDNVSMKTIIPHLLSDMTKFHCVAYFPNGKEALEYLRYNYCDLMFLGVEMQGMDGFELLDHLDTYPAMPLTIVMTADEDRYSKKAHLYYSKGMIDYVSKSSGKERITISLERFERALKKELYHSNKTKITIGTILTKDEFPDLENHSISQITHFIHKKNYTYFHFCDGRSHPVYISLAQVERTLPVGVFLKINRDCIVMLCHIKKYSEDAVWIKNANDNETIRLPISFRRRDSVHEELKKLFL